MALLASLGQPSRSDSLRQWRSEAPSRILKSSSKRRISARHFWASDRGHMTSTRSTSPRPRVGVGYAGYDAGSCAIDTEGNLLSDLEGRTSLLGGLPVEGKTRLLSTESSLDPLAR